MDKPGSEPRQCGLSLSLLVHARQGLTKTLDSLLSPFLQWLRGFLRWMCKHEVLTVPPRECTSGFYPSAATAKPARQVVVWKHLHVCSLLFVVFGILTELISPSFYEIYRFLLYLIPRPKFYWFELSCDENNDPEYMQGFFQPLEPGFVFHGSFWDAPPRSKILPFASRSGQTHRVVCELLV